MLKSLRCMSCITCPLAMTKHTIQHSLKCLIASLINSQHPRKAFALISCSGIIFTSHSSLLDAYWCHVSIPWCSLLVSVTPDSAEGLYTDAVQLRTQQQTEINSWAALRRHLYCRTAFIQQTKNQNSWRTALWRINPFPFLHREIDT